MNRRSAWSENSQRLRPWPGAHWGIYAGGGFIVGALLYTKMIELLSPLFARFAIEQTAGAGATLAPTQLEIVLRYLEEPGQPM